MTDNEVLDLLRSTQAFRRGHFELTSGLHSPFYLQCALVLQHPAHAERLGRALAAKFSGTKIDAVASPALGGIVLGHEVARALGVRALFSERGASSHLELRRGFAVSPGERILVVEDVLTTGGSVRGTIQVVQAAGGRVVAVGVIVDRAGDRVAFDVPLQSLAKLDLEKYTAEHCPLCRSGSKAEKPGSRAAGPPGRAAAH